MTRNDNPHALRLAAALQGVKGDAAANDFARNHPLSKAADLNRKFDWAHEVCCTLVAHCTPDEAIAIRRSCRCGDGTTMAKEIAACIKKGGNLADGCVLFTEKNKYAFLEYVNDNELLFGYHACVCSCVKRVNEPLSLLWCECSAGYAEAMFRQLFGASVTVDLLDSVKAGAERCTMQIRW